MPFTGMENIEKPEKLFFEPAVLLSLIYRQKEHCRKKTESGPETNESIQASDPA